MAQRLRAAARGLQAVPDQRRAGRPRPLALLPAHGGRVCGAQGGDARGESGAAAWESEGEGDGASVAGEGAGGARGGGVEEGGCGDHGGV